MDKTLLLSFDAELLGELHAAARSAESTPQILLRRAARALVKCFHANEDVMPLDFEVVRAHPFTPEGLKKFYAQLESVGLKPDIAQSMVAEAQADYFPPLTPAALARAETEALEAELIRRNKSPTKDRKP